MILNTGYKNLNIRNFADDLAVHVYCNSPMFLRMNDVSEEMLNEKK